MIESEVGVDIRKSLFYTLAEKNWPLIGMEALGMSLEDIFIAVVDQSAAKTTQRYARKTKTASRQSAEDEMAKNILENADKKRGGEFTSLFGSGENDNK